MVRVTEVVIVPLLTNVEEAPNVSTFPPNDKLPLFVHVELQVIAPLLYVNAAPPTKVTLLLYVAGDIV